MMRQRLYNSTERFFLNCYITSFFSDGWFVHRIYFCVKSRLGFVDLRRAIPTIERSPPCIMSERGRMA
jgi:hypothetical protein